MNIVNLLGVEAAVLTALLEHQATLRPQELGVSTQEHEALRPHIVAQKARVAELTRIAATEYGVQVG
jgi:hypothetical protein